MFVCSRSEALRVLKIKGDLSCCYAGGEWPRRCDCKYGGPEEGGGGEKTGCPELATLYRLIEAMDDATWDMMLSKAGHTLLHARAASQQAEPQTRVEVLATFELPDSGRVHARVTRDPYMESCGTCGVGYGWNGWNGDFCASCGGSTPAPTAVAE